MPRLGWPLGQPTTQVDISPMEWRDTTERENNKGLSIVSISIFVLFDQPIDDPTDHTDQKGPPESSPESLNHKTFDEKRHQP